MNTAERADQLERDSGLTLDHFPYSEADYARHTRLRGLDRLRAVQYVPYRKACWRLYWVCLAIHGPAGVEGETTGDEWRMSDEDFDTSSPRMPPEINGILRAEWDGFNKKMDRWAAKRYRETGVMVSDSEKREHTARFAAICRNRYGYSYPERLQDTPASE